MKESMFTASKETPTVCPQAWLWQLTDTLLPLSLPWFGESASTSGDGKASLGWEPGKVEVGVSGSG